MAMIIRTTAAGISSALGVDIVIVAGFVAASAAMVSVVAADFMAVAAAMAADTDNFHESPHPFLPRDTATRGGAVTSGPSDHRELL